jgi:hypothetical protein
VFTTATALEPRLAASALLAAEEDVREEVMASAARARTIVAATAKSSTVTTSATARFWRVGTGDKRPGRDVGCEDIIDTL